MDSASRLYLEGLGGKRLKCCCLFHLLLNLPTKVINLPTREPTAFFAIWSEDGRGEVGRGAEKSCEELSCGLLPVTPDDCRRMPHVRDGAAEQASFHCPRRLRIVHS